MKRNWLPFLLTLLFIFPAIVFAAEEKSKLSLEERLSGIEKKLNEQIDGNQFKAYFDKGLRFKTANGKHKFKVGGRMQLDFDWFANEPTATETAVNGEFTDGVEFRRIRLYLAGVAWKHLEFKGQYDFAGGNTSIKDVYAGLVKMKYANFRLGHFKVPFSLEELTSDNFTTFDERALPTLFAKSRQVGFMAYNTVIDKMFSWYFDIFRQTDEGNGAADGKWNFATRLVVRPYYREKGRKMLHFGLAYLYANPDDSTVRYRQRPEVHQSPYFVDSGEIAADDEHLLGLEMAAIYGPASLQGEYIMSYVASPLADNPLFHSFYLQVSYFLTGENRNYKTSSSAFSAPKTRTNAFDDGWGAFEAGLRYSYLDLNDANINGGKLASVGLVLNWYLNTNFRVISNYQLADLDGAELVNMYSMRFQWGF